jgi:tetratricopeptide (TPR) repeat protein
MPRDAAPRDLLFGLMALKAVCLEAMARRPADPYGSARALAEDLERWMADEPVTARRAPLGERAQRWMRRRLTAVAAVQAAANRDLTARNLDLSLAQAETATERDEKAKETAKVGAINRFLIQGILAQANPENNSVGDKLSVAAAVDHAARSVATSFPDQPDVEAEVRQTLGDTYTGLGLFEKASVHHRAADELITRTRGDADSTALLVRSSLGPDLAEPGRWAGARALLERVVADQSRFLGREHHDTLVSLTNLGWVLRYQGQYDRAEATLRGVVAARRRDRGPDDRETLASEGGLALTSHSQQKYEEAEALQCEALAARRREPRLYSDHLFTLWAVGTLARTLRARGRHEA